MQQYTLLESRARVSLLERLTIIDLFDSLWSVGTRLHHYRQS